MSFLGFNAPVNVRVDNLIGTITWLNPTNTFSSDDNKATSVLTVLDPISNYLICDNFRFSLPIWATIKGVEFSLEKSSTVGSAVSDHRIRLTKNGVIGSTDKSVGGNWSTSDSVQSYGGASDLWGEILTPGDVMASGFGIAIAATTSLAATAQIDQVLAKIYYDFPFVPKNVFGSNIIIKL